MKKFKLFIIIIVLSLVNLSFAAESPEKYLLKAKKFMKEMRFEPAFEMAKLALVAAESKYSGEKLLDYKIFMGKLYFVQENFTKAYDVFTEALEIADKIGDKKSEKVKCRINNDLALVLAQEKKYDLAVLKFKEAIELYKEIYKGKNLTISIPVINLAEVYRLKGDFLNAEERYLEGKTLRKKDTDPKSLPVLLIKSGLAVVYSERGKTGEAKKLIGDIENIDLKNSTVAVTILDNVSAACKTLGLTDKSKNFSDKADQIALEVFPDKHSRNINK